MSARRGRPRKSVNEQAIVDGYTDGGTIAGLAREHGVDRYVIRRVLDEHEVPRRERRGAHWAPKRKRDGTFPCGHPREAGNSRGGRNECLTCHRERERKRYAAQRAA